MSEECPCDRMAVLETSGRYVFSICRECGEQYVFLTTDDPARAKGKMGWEEGDRDPNTFTAKDFHDDN